MIPTAYIRTPKHVHGTTVWYGPTPAHPDKEVIPGIHIPFAPLTSSELRQGYFDVVINVTDSPEITFCEELPCIKLWFPIMEMSRWSFENLYAGVKALENYSRLGRYIYVHCSSGVCRSAALCELWLYAKGLSFSEIHSADKMASSHRRTVIEDEIEAGKIDPRILGALRWMFDPKNPSYSAQGVIGAISPQWQHETFRSAKHK